MFAARNGPSVRIRGDAGEWRQAFGHPAPFDSMMTHCADPRDALDLLLLRERMRDWRFYDHFRTDRDAPARRPQVGTYTPVLASDGADLAAAIETIRAIGDETALSAAIVDAFPGGSMEIAETESGSPACGFGEAGKPDFWIGGEGGLKGILHVALAAADRATVDAFHRAALVAGGRDNGAPGLRPHYHANYYGAFVLDPDGHNVEAVCHRP